MGRLLWAQGGLGLTSVLHIHLDGLMQERRNPNVLAMELRLSCINPLIWSTKVNLLWLSDVPHGNVD